MSDEQRMKVVKGIGLGVVVLLLAMGGNFYQQWNETKETVLIIGEEDQPVDDTEEVIEIEAAKETIYVHIAGAVESPGVYGLEEGERIEDALGLAGVTEEALVDQYLNRAALLYDGQKIIVPSAADLGEDKALPLVVNGEFSSDLVNLNYAGQSELEELTGIGPAKAQAILDYREANGGFRSIEELKKVKGIGDKTFEGLKEEVMI